jgi:hypothetical protein
MSTKVFVVVCVYIELSLVVLEKGFIYRGWEEDKYRPMQL